MPGFLPAQGGYDIMYGVPNSAFSRGDVLELTSLSSLSRADPVAGGPILGVALQDSIDSINDRVCVAIPGADTVFLSVVTAASAHTPGERLTVDEDQFGRSFASTSDLTARLVVVRGNVAGGVPYPVAGSGVSRIMVKFLRQGDSISSLALA